MFKHKIFRFNLIIIVILLLLVTITFNFAINFYLERETFNQLSSTAEQTTNDIMPNLKEGNINYDANLDPYAMVNPPFRKPLSILNAEYLFIDENMTIFIPPEEGSIEITEFENNIVKEVFVNQKSHLHDKIKFEISNIPYAALVIDIPIGIIPHVSHILIYSSLEKIKELQFTMNIILLAIFLIAGIIVAIFSSYLSKNISTPLSSLCNHIKTLSERDFNNKIDIKADGEILELVNHINIMSNKLNNYDQAQKMFLQNASHEFRTPLMSIQSYAEGLKFNIVDTNIASDIIIAETKRLTLLVEDLLYLSRLDTIEETYHFDTFNLNEILYSCVDRMNAIALKYDKKIIHNLRNENIKITADFEILSRAITNILSNCIRYTKENISINLRVIDNNKVELLISDDGDGFDKNDIQNVFERFYKGKKGNYGLGLAITKNIIIKHKGEISASNNSLGAEFKIVLPIINDN
jgi:signal transduction histidine kinase